MMEKRNAGGSRPNSRPTNYANGELGAAVAAEREIIRECSQEPLEDISEDAPMRMPPAWTVQRARGNGMDYVMDSALGGLGKLPGLKLASEDPMELLSRTWSISALEVAKATTSARPAAAASASTAQMVMERIMGQSDPPPYQLAAKRKSHSLSGSLSHINVGNCSAPASPPASPRQTMDDLTFCRSFSGVRNPLREMSMKRWLRDSKEKKKEAARVHNAQVHAAVSVAGVAAAVAAVTAATSAGDGHVHRKTHSRHQRFADEAGASSACMAAVASAAALVAAQCVEVAEGLGADRDHVSSVVSSAVNVKTPGDIMTLTAAAATALRRAATLNARIFKEGHGHVSVIPYYEKDEKSAPPSASGESGSEDSEAECGCQLDFLRRGAEFLKRTRKGELHWRTIFVYLNQHSQVVVKSQGKYVGGTIVKNKNRIVRGVCEEIPAWGGRGEEDEGMRWYFGIRTEEGGMMELECRSHEEHRLWTNGISRLLSLSQQQQLHHHKAVGSAPSG